MQQTSTAKLPRFFQKILKTVCTLRVNEFQKGKECGDEKFTIPLTMFEITKPFIFVEVTYCELNEIKSKHFLKKFHKFTNSSFRMAITWKTRNIQSLFPLKEKKRLKIVSYL